MARDLKTFHAPLPDLKRAAPPVVSRGPKFVATAPYFALRGVYIPCSFFCLWLQCSCTPGRVQEVSGIRHKVEEHVAQVRRSSGPV